MSELKWRCIAAVFIGCSILFGLDAGRRCQQLEIEVCELRGSITQQVGLSSDVVESMHSINRQVTWLSDIVGRIADKAQLALDQLAVMNKAQ